MGSLDLDTPLVFGCVQIDSFSRVYKCFLSHFPSTEALRTASLSWNVGRGKPLKENRGERWFDVDWTAKMLSCKVGEFASQGVSLARLWIATRTYQGYLGQF